MSGSAICLYVSSLLRMVVMLSSSRVIRIEPHREHSSSSEPYRLPEVVSALHLLQMRRDVSRRSSSDSGTSSTMACTGNPVIIVSSDCACTIVRGKPSSTNPAAVSLADSRSLTRSIIM